jgi:hypothetical protein
MVRLHRIAPVPGEAARWQRGAAEIHPAMSFPLLATASRMANGLAGCSPAYKRRLFPQDAILTAQKDLFSPVWPERTMAFPDHRLGDRLLRCPQVGAVADHFVRKRPRQAIDVFRKGRADSHGTVLCRLANSSGCDHCSASRRMKRQWSSPERSPKLRSCGRSPTIQSTV